MINKYSQNVGLFKALADINRLMIVDMISSGELCACKILEKFDITQPTLSHHMKILCDCELVNGRKEGKWMHYSLNAEKVEDLKKFLTDIIGREILMKTMFIYEPAMCCETGICGVSVDPELLRISTVVNNLKKNGIMVKRYNLNNFPQEFIDNVEINKLINGIDGVDALPAIVVDGKIVKTKSYPTNAEITVWLDIPENYLESESAEIDDTSKSQDCCCDGECC